jgi:hypothetical protein
MKPNRTMLDCYGKISRRRCRLIHFEQTSVTCRPFSKHVSERLHADVSRPSEVLESAGETLRGPSDFLKPPFIPLGSDVTFLSPLERGRMMKRPAHSQERISLMTGPYDSSALFNRMIRQQPPVQGLDSGSDKRPG